jgi:hypothetical protein
MDDAERIALGMVDAERKRRQKVRGAEVIEIDGLVLALSNLPDPALNSIVVEREPRDAAAALREAAEVFEDRKQPLGIDFQLGRHPSVDEVVRGSRLTRIIERPGLAVAIRDLPDAAPPEGIDIRQVSDERGADALVRVGADAFGDDPAVGAAFYGASAYGLDGVKSFLAWDGEDPVAIASSYLHQGAVGILGVGVVQEARRRGIGSAITVAAAGSFPGAHLAWLHPSEMARGMYGLLGFRRVSDWEVWVDRGPGTADHGP